MGDKFEDDLISETFLKYLESGDETWPLLFPMTKSAVKAMDAIQEITTKYRDVPVEKFVVTGGSKRGWTTWLTGVVDKRVAGIAPIVIDTLNLQPQMKHQIEIWGKYSEQIADYTRKGLVKVMQEQPEVPLWRWVDPYTYRKQLTLPKLLINGTNDRYWVVDALNIYWDGLVGDKYILYVPNAGHGLGDGKEFALTTLAAFVKHLATDTAMPELKWEHSQADGQLQLNVSATPKPGAVRLWSATSDNGDFREVKWNSTPMKQDGNGYHGQVPVPDQGNAALYGEAQFVIDGLKYSLTTQIHRE
jgi:PhoPQ-activated pathogenicity-related protein